jgi:hypothetical protein
MKVCDGIRRAMVLTDGFLSRQVMGANHALPPCARRRKNATTCAKKGGEVAGPGKLLARPCDLGHVGPVVDCHPIQEPENTN